MDCDRNENNDNCGIGRDELHHMLQQCLDNETELLRTYTILAERVHYNDELQNRLQNFAQGNAKRTRQLLDELNQIRSR